MTSRAQIRVETSTLMRPIGHEHRPNWGYFFGGCPGRGHFFRLCNMATLVRGVCVVRACGRGGRMYARASPRAVSIPASGSAVRSSIAADSKSSRACRQNFVRRHAPKQNSSEIAPKQNSSEILSARTHAQATPAVVTGPCNPPRGHVPALRNRGCHRVVVVFVRASVRACCLDVSTTTGKRQRRTECPSRQAAGPSCSFIGSMVGSMVDSGSGSSGSLPGSASWIGTTTTSHEPSSKQCDERPADAPHTRMGPISKELAVGIRPRVACGERNPN